MALEDFMEPEVGIAIAATAALSSPKVREVARRGLVYGLAGVMMAGDYMAAFAQGVRRGVQETADEASALAEDTEEAEGEAAAEAAPAPRRTQSTRTRQPRAARH